MSIIYSMRLAAMAAMLTISLHAQADSFVSSASSAGSASSGSVSDSLSDSSNSSSGGNKVADGDYRIIEIAPTPGRADRTRLTLQAAEPAHRIVLDLPQTTFAQQGLAAGDTVYASNRPYGVEFGRRTTERQPFYLVLADEWHDELASRPVTL
ncbi:MAG: hypothetical protein ABW202_07125 [Duganella sp.]